MPKATSVRQRRFFGAERSRKRRGLQTKTSMTTASLRRGAGTKEKGLPLKAKVRKRKSLRVR